MDKNYMLKNHKKLWTWLAKNPNKQKWDWPEWKLRETICKSCCFPCQYVVERYGQDAQCMKSHSRYVLCPLDFFRASEYSGCLDSLYGQWKFADDNYNPVEKSRLAWIIADLPLREDLIFRKF